TVDLGKDIEGKRKQKLVTCESLREARQKQRDMESAVSNGTFCDCKKMNLAEYLRYWLEQYAKSNVEQTTYGLYKLIIDKHLVPAIGAIPLAKLQPAHVQKYYSGALTGGRKDGKHKLGRSLSPTTVLQHHRILHKALDSAVKWEIVSRNVCDAVEAPRKQKKQMQVLTEKQVEVLLSSLNGHYLYMPTYLALATGMRRNEILALTWVDVNLKERTLTVRQAVKSSHVEQAYIGLPKTEKGRRTINIAPEVVREFKKHSKEQARNKLQAGELWQDNNLVCCLQNGQAIVPSTLSTSFRKVAEKAGLKLRFHDLRHSCASFLLKLGINPKTVQELLGHENIETTLGLYSHLLPGVMDEAACKLAKAVLPTK
ncbi:MAG: site-specific integrase, partial [Candidatus Desulforudis sp.]|nr:site-specific integrase [Bacillota bacterium]MBV1770087.1 site-specific integrase [Desulforudis sp.]